MNSGEIDHRSQNSRNATQKPKRGRIGLDLHVVSGIYQGSRTHCLELFSRVIEIGTDFDFIVFAEQLDALRDFNDSFTSANCTLVEMKNGGPIKRLLWDLPRLARSFECDLLHTQYILPVWMGCCGAVTIHDVLFETHPEYFHAAFRWRSHLLVKMSARRSRIVFTVSDFSRRELTTLYGIEADQIHVLHNGVDRSRFYPGPDGIEYVRSRGLTTKGYILSVGRLEPRKNHKGLLLGYALLDSPRPPLVIVGQRAFGYESIFDLIRQLELQNDVIVLEDISDTELPGLYRHAVAFAYPTFAEGFGMPIIEAMACGVPVIVSNTGAIPEVVRDSGLYVRPDSAGEIHDALDRILRDPQLRNVLIQRGQERVVSFNWDVSASRLYESYRTYFTQVRDQGLCI